MKLHDVKLRARRYLQELVEIIVTCAWPKPKLYDTHFWTACAVHAKNPSLLLTCVSMEVQCLTQQCLRIAYNLTYTSKIKLTGIYKSKLNDECETESSRIADVKYSVRRNDRTWPYSESGTPPRRLVPSDGPGWPSESKLGPTACTSAMGPLSLHTSTQSSDDGRMERSPPSPTAKRKSRVSFEPCTNPYSFLQSSLLLFMLLVASLLRVAGCCSSRTTPRIHPSLPTSRPDITFQQYACPPMYAALLCLNGGTCFSVKIVNSMMYNCECAEGYVGERCQLRGLTHSYNSQVIIETASIAGGACFAIVLVFFVLVALYVYVNRRKRYLNDPYHDENPLSSETCPGLDCDSGPTDSLKKGRDVLLLKSLNDVKIAIANLKHPGFAERISTVEHRISSGGTRLESIFSLISPFAAVSRPIDIESQSLERRGFCRDASLCAENGSGQSLSSAGDSVAGIGDSSTTSPGSGTDASESRDLAAPPLLDDPCVLTVLQSGIVLEANQSQHFRSFSDHVLS